VIRAIAIVPFAFSVLIADATCTVNPQTNRKPPPPPTCAAQGYAPSIFMDNSCKITANCRNYNGYCQYQNVQQSCCCYGDGTGCGENTGVPCGACCSGSREYSSYGIISHACGHGGCVLGGCF
jgi:hypothetical protein